MCCTTIHSYIFPFFIISTPTQRRGHRPLSPGSLASSSRKVRRPVKIKPLINQDQPPKPSADQMKEDYAAMMLKGTHYPSRYGNQAEKLIPTVNATKTSALLMVDLK